MNSDQHNDASARALRLLIDEVRMSEPPELDWERVERQTLASIDSAPVEQARRPRTAGALVFAAAAAALVMMVAGQRGPSPTARHGAARTIDVATLPVAHESVTVPATPGPARPLQPGYRLSSNQTPAAVEAHDAPVRFLEPNVAGWVLEPGSRAVVEHVGLPTEIALERGTVRADVVPRSAAEGFVEAFIVDAGGARVAVHGTSFSVERQGDRVLVEVTHGIVSVGPAGHRGGTTGSLLASPARAAFSAADGHLIEVYAAPADTAPAAEPSAITARNDEAARPSASASAASPGEPDASATASADGPAARNDARNAEPSPVAHADKAPVADSAASAPEEEKAPEVPKPRLISVDEARAIMVACLSADVTTGESDATRVTVSTQVTVQLGADQKVSTIVFDPPLRPDLQSRCGGALFGSALDTSGSASFRIHFATH